MSPEVRKSVDTIQANLGKQFDAFRKEVDGWLARGRKTSAQTPPAARHAPAPPPQAKPKTQASDGTTGPGQHSTPTANNTPNGATRRSERFKSLSNKVLSILGEHMADYHCQDVKGWGQKAAHDKAQKNPAKLNDNGHLVQLWPIKIRGRGIDAVWKCNGSKPYAVIEAKASYDPTKKTPGIAGRGWGQDGEGWRKQSASRWPLWSCGIERKHQ